MDTSFLSTEQKTSTAIRDTFLAVDPYKKMASSDKVSFDLNTRCLNETPSSVIVKTEDDYNPEVSIKKTPSKEWELDVRALISTKKWLQNYGLHKNKLAMQQILPVIGFKMSEDYDLTLKRPVSSKYAEGMFNQLMRSDGKMFNITCGRDKLRQLENRLQQAIHLYKRRLEWLTSESRRLFGVVEEKAITIVLDIKNMSPQQFDMYRMGLERVLYEQVTQVAKFNLIRANDEISMYQDHCVPVTHDTIEGAIKWLWSLDRLAGVSNTACVEAVLRAIEDKQNEAIYLYTEGSSVDTCRQLLKEKICAVQRKPPIHAVSYNCENSDTIRFLREFASAAGGRSHVYAIVMEMDSYEGLPVDPNTNKANIMLKKKTFGGIPPGAGVREDIVLLFQEMEEARNNLIQVQKLIGMTPEPNIVLESELAPQVDVEKINEQYMSSRHWLDKYGLGAKKLELFDALGGVAFHHRDGVVDLQSHPLDEYQTDALRYKKLVNAKYCDRFPVVRWKDGKVVHVQVTPELHRTYEQKMLVALRAVQNRIDWLNQGSRSLFGTLIEDQIYIVIDTSESMVPSIQYVKDKLFLLMQEQLRHKMKFNLIAFNSKAQVWQNRLVDVTETSLEGAWRWIQGLSCWGSTNTYAALQHALSDPGTQAIYLLTDGRPDQPPKSIIAQVQMQHSVPVHTISFNCNDAEANHFMYDLARATGGRYHYFSEKGADLEGQPESFESEDIRLLKDEIKRGLENLDKVAELRDECAKLSWKKEIDDMKKCSRRHPMPGTDRVSAVPAMDPQDLYRSNSPTPPPRPSSAPPDRDHIPTPPPPRVTTSVETREFTLAKRRPRSSRPSSARGPVAKPLAAGHTRTSLLRTLNSQGKFNSDEWLLPETRQLFEKQASRQKKLAQAPNKGLVSVSDEEFVLEKHGLAPHFVHRVEAREQRALERRPRSRRFKKIRSMSSKQWLQRNGLVARKLTLLDALAPTMIPHRSKYVPILDKHVLAKVFDEVLPIAHVSNKSRQPIKLINPNGVNLKAYEEKLERVLGLFNRRLDALVWDAIPKDTRDEEFGDIDGPVSFINNRSWFMKALQEANWPICEHDITLLEDEIARGERYLQQSKDLRKAATDGNEDDDITVYDDKASNVSGLSARSKELSRSKESVASSTSSSASDKSAKSKDSHSTHSSKGSKSSQHKVGSLETKQKRRAVRRPPDKDSGSNRTEPSEDEEKVESETTDQEKDEMVGLRVIACNKQDGLYYPGYVSHTPESAYAIVNFNNQRRQKVRTQMIIPMSGAIARPELAPGDFALVRVFYQTMKSECFVPAIVEVTPEDARHHAKFYSLLLYNGQRETTMRKFIVKIGKSRFEMAIRYIAHVQQQKILRQESALSEESSALPSPQSQSSKRSDDDVSSTRSLQSGRGRRKKEKITKKLVHKKEYKEAQKSRRKSKSRSRSRSQSSKSSRSRSHSRSSSSSRSRSRSQSSRSQSERSRSRSGSSRSRSRSSERSGSSRTKSVSSRSRSRSSERSGNSRKKTVSRKKSVSSRSRSQSSERSGRSRTRSVSSRSRSRSSSSSTVRSKSSVKRSRDSRPKSAAPPRSRTSRSSKSSRSRSRSRSQGSDGSKGSTTPRARSPYDRPRRPTPSAHRTAPLIRTDSMLNSEDVTRKDIYNEPASQQSQNSKTSKLVNVDEKDEMIHALQYQLEKQKRKQFRQERRLVRQARKINKIRRKLRDSDVSHNESGHSTHSDRSDRTKSRRSSSSETDTSPQRRKGSPDGTSYGDSPDIQNQQRSLQGLRVKQEVLARWQDDGWFYRGCVVAEGKDQKYVIRDCTGHMENIMRDDILTDSEHKFDAIQPEDHVVGLHPKYVFSYAPAEVLSTYANSSVKVEFFDGNIAELTSEEVYKIPKAKFDQVVEYIKRCEKNLIGRSVVAREDDSGLFKLAVVDSRVGLGQRYYIKWLDGDMSKQNANHIFEVGKRQTRHDDWSHVLAPISQHSMTFMPAEVIQSNPLVVQFCNGKRSSDATFDQCFWLSKDYYNNARGYLMDIKYRKLTDDIHSSRDRE